MAASDSLIVELEAAVQGGSREKRIETLRRITDLFLNGSDRFNETQIHLFDDVLLRLIKRVETTAIAELSARLAPVDNAPNDLIRRLARYDEITVAGPVLCQSARLTTNDLIEIAETKSQGHLFAISGRAQLEPAVTDVLLERGDREVARNLAQNLGASFSEAGYTTLVNRAETDESLAFRVGLRLDIPLRLLRELLLKATEAVRSRLLAMAPPDSRDEIRRVLASISSDVIHEATTPRNLGHVQDLVLQMQQTNHLDEEAVLKFANSHRHDEVIVSLSLLCAAPVELVERFMQDIRCDGVLIACKAAGLKWPTVSAILTHRFIPHSISSEELAQAKVDFIRLSKATAQRVLRFARVRETAISDVVQEGPEAARELVQMLRVLNVDPAMLDRTDWAMMRDLQRRCGICGHKSECRRELAAGHAGEHYRHFCPNTDRLDTLAR